MLGVVNLGSDLPFLVIRLPFHRISWQLNCECLVIQRRRLKLEHFSIWDIHTAGKVMHEKINFLGGWMSVAQALPRTIYEQRLTLPEYHRLWTLHQLISGCVVFPGDIIVPSILFLPYKSTLNSYKPLGLRNGPPLAAWELASLPVTSAVWPRRRCWLLAEMKGPGGCMEAKRGSARLLPFLLVCSACHL